MTNNWQELPETTQRQVFKAWLEANPREPLFDGNGLGFAGLKLDNYLLYPISHGALNWRLNGHHTINHLIHTKNLDLTPVYNWGVANGLIKQPEPVEEYWLVKKSDCEEAYLTKRIMIYQNLAQTALIKDGIVEIVE